MGQDELLTAFLRSDVVGGIEYIATDDLRTVGERFFAAARSLGHDPGSLTPEGLRATLEQALPGQYPPQDPLGQRTIDILRTYLAFLEPRLAPGSARALVETLEDCAEPFRERVREA